MSSAFVLKDYLTRRTCRKLQIDVPDRWGEAVIDPVPTAGPVEPAEPTAEASDDLEGTEIHPNIQPPPISVAERAKKLLGVSMRLSNPELLLQNRSRTASNVVDLVIGEEDEEEEDERERVRAHEQAIDYMVTRKASKGRLSVALSGAIIPAEDDRSVHGPLPRGSRGISFRIGPSSRSLRVQDPVPEYDEDDRPPSSDRFVRPPIPGMSPHPSTRSALRPSTADKGRRRVSIAAPREKGDEDEDEGTPRRAEPRLADRAKSLDTTMASRAAAYAQAYGNDDAAAGPSPRDSSGARPQTAAPAGASSARQLMLFRGATSRMSLFSTPSVRPMTAPQSPGAALLASSQENTFRVPQPRQQQQLVLPQHPPRESLDDDLGTVHRPLPRFLDDYQEEFDEEDEDEERERDARYQGLSVRLKGSHKGSEKDPWSPASTRPSTARSGDRSNRAALASIIDRAAAAHASGQSGHSLYSLGPGAQHRDPHSVSHTAVLTPPRTPPASAGAALSMGLGATMPGPGGMQASPAGPRPSSPPQRPSTAQRQRNQARPSTALSLGGSAGGGRSTWVHQYPESPLAGRASRPETDYGYGGGVRSSRAPSEAPGSAASSRSTSPARKLTVVVPEENPNARSIIIDAGDLLTAQDHLDAATEVYMDSRKAGTAVERNIFSVPVRNAATPIHCPLSPLLTGDDGRAWEEERHPIRARDVPAPPALYLWGSIKHSKLYELRERVQSARGPGKSGRGPA